MPDIDRHPANPVDEEEQRALDDAAEAAQRPHDDADERERRQKAAERAEENPRRMG